MAGTVAPAALRDRLASGEPAPVYVLLGDDEHEKAALVSAFEAIVDVGVRVFNCERFPWRGETARGGAGRRPHPCR